ncbi:unnamed protein product [Acanthoscelides obtectus]|uniref:PiggyBac transposable element-derived protein domain-containing protein n=1 Tax=Acanthoscelides obtectus TaxID=200917 RepID=A0A9P0JWN2_ACAOB|nr:unnamed protein product [Acanthoscelides obtectus]CAK1668081.1 PiggyBac transposable element-derived protein 3 [Acanthoscelides obtectus]
MQQDFDPEDDLPIITFRNQHPTPAVQIAPKWKKADLPFVNSECKVIFTNEKENDSTPLSYFKLFFDDNLIQHITDQTNLYSTQQTGACINTTFTEISQFLGINIMSGIVRMPSYRMYWAQETRYSPIADTMSRDRFDKLRTQIHCNDNTNMLTHDHPDYDKLFKIRPVIDALKLNMSKIEQEEYNSVDEIMVPFKGRSSLKQFIRNKPHKWGIKIFARAGISGIIYDFEIYRGKGTVKETNLGISGDIVIRLVETLPRNINYKVFTDNWFTSYKLFCELKKLGIFASGTVRIARLPGCQMKSDAELKKEGRGSFDFCTEKNENIFAVKWFDNKTVHVVSTYIGLQPIENVKRWSSSEKKFIDLPQPYAIQIYNKYMGGVDLNDMLVSLYRIKIGVRRYYLRIIYHLIDICIVNAWLLYRRDCSARGIKKYKRLVTFRAEVAHAMLQQNAPLRRRGRPSDAEVEQPPRKRPVVPRPIDDVRFDGFSHWPEHIEPKQRCRNCIKSYARIS